MPTASLTQAFAETVTLKAVEEDVIWWDTALRGFGLRVRRVAGGKVEKSWIAWARIKGSKQQRKIRFGPAGKGGLSAAKAREMANDILAKARLGIDDVGDRKATAAAAAAAPKTGTLGPAFERYLKQAESRLRPKTLAEVRRHLLRDWAPIAHMTASAIGRVEVNARLGEIAAEHGPIAANRSRASLSAFFAWAIYEGLADVNPMLNARRPEPEHARARVLSRAELAAIWNASGEDAYGQILKLLVLTGARRQEIGSLAIEEINFERRVWILPRAAAKPGKSIPPNFRSSFRHPERGNRR